MKTVAALLVLGIAGTALLGCGGDEAAPSSAAVHSGGPPTVTQATAIARAVNLHQSDVPYFEAKPADDDEPDLNHKKRAERELSQCLGFNAGSNENRIVHLESSEYGVEPAGASLSVQSSVDVVRNRELAAKRAVFYRGRRAARCLKRFFITVFEGTESHNAEITQVVVTRLATPVPEADASFGYQFVATVTVHPETSELAAYHPGASERAAVRSVRVYTDILVFLDGPTEVGLTATGIPSPVSTTLESRLLSVLYQRAEEHRP